MSETVRVQVRPPRSLLVAAFVSSALVMLPVFGVLYWFGAEHDNVPVVLAVHVAVILIGVLLLFRQLSVATTVTESEIRGRGIFSPMVRVPLDRVAHVDLIPTYVGQAPEPTVQLLLRDSAGKRIFRMRGNFWPQGDLEKVAAELPVLAKTAAEPISLDEFFSTYPGSAYWFENRPVLIAVILTAAIVVSLATAAWVMSILRMPIGF